MTRVLYIDKAIEEYGEHIIFFYKETLEKFDIDFIYTVDYTSPFKFLSKERYDAIVCDPVSRVKNKLNLSNGFNLIKKIQTQYKDIPIIVLTGIDRDNIIEYLKEENIEVSGVVTKGSQSDILLLITLNDILNLKVDPSIFSGRLVDYNVKIFICYAKEDLEKASHIYQILRKKGFLPWIDKENLRKAGRC